MEFSVKLCEPFLVRPAGHDLVRNHNGDAEYFLSNLDLAVPGIVETVFCFKATQEMNSVNRPTDVIRHSLSKLLTLYSPLAGRLNINAEGRMYVQCTGEGAVFVEAHADCSLDDIELDMTNPDYSILKRLVYGIPGADTNILLMPPLVVQVTTFKCGGLVLGLAVNHLFCDGFSSMEILNAWTELARGVTLSVRPFLDRTLLRARSPLDIEFPHLEYAKIEDAAGPKEISGEKAQYEYRYFTFGSHHVDKLKKLAMRDGTGPKCTTFEVLSAHVWMCRTKALGVPANQQVKLLFVVDVRKQLEPPLPKGYFGNAIYSAYAICSAGELLGKGLSFGVELIKNAVARLTDKYMRSAIDYMEVGHPALPLENTVEISSWSRIPYTTTDFGWGKPVQSGPASPPPHKDFVIFLSYDKGKSIDILLGLPPRCMRLLEKYIFA